MAARITIRVAKNEELSQIKGLSVDELPDELNEYERPHAEEAKKVFARRLDQLLQKGGNEFFVAEVDGAQGIAGYVWFGISERPFSDMKVGWIYDLLVVPTQRGKGVGEALLRHALGVSKKRGFELSGLMVRANNNVAYSLYEKLDFKPEYVLMTRKESGAQSASNS